MTWVVGAGVVGLTIFALGPRWIIWLAVWPARRRCKLARLRAEEARRQADYAKVRLQEWKL